MEGDRASVLLLNSFLLSILEAVFKKGCVEVSPMSFSLLDEADLKLWCSKPVGKNKEDDNYLTGEILIMGW